LHVQTAVCTQPEPGTHTSAVQSSPSSHPDGRTLHLRSFASQYSQAEQVAHSAGTMCMHPEAGLHQSIVFASPSSHGISSRRQASRGGSFASHLPMAREQRSTHDSSVQAFESSHSALGSVPVTIWHS